MAPVGEQRRVSAPAPRTPRPSLSLVYHAGRSQGAASESSISQKILGHPSSQNRPDLRLSLWPRPPCVRCLSLRAHRANRLASRLPETTHLRFAPLAGPGPAPVRISRSGRYPLRSIALRPRSSTCPAYGGLPPLLFICSTRPIPAGYAAFFNHA